MAVLGIVTATVFLKGIKALNLDLFTKTPVTFGETGGGIAHAFIGSLILVAAFVTLGAMAFLALGYVIASFAKTEDSANGMTSMIQFPMMFLSGAFFQIDQLPQFL